MAARPVNGLALCAGVGTIELGLRLALGARYRTVGYVERQTFPASVLVARMGDKAMDSAPVWDDIATFDGTPWRHKVDIVTAGFPCQPFSQAGSRTGTSDNRWLWPHLSRVIDEVQPSLVFVENVPGLVRHGLDEILTDLAAGGFDAEWDSFGAIDVGAPHNRKRLWLLAYRDSERLAVVRVPPRQRRHQPHRQGGKAVALWPAMPDDAPAWTDAPTGPEPCVCRTSHGMAHRMDRLHAIGNGVVPLVAAYALIRLAGRARGDTGAPVTAATQSSRVAQPDRSAATTGCADRHG